LKTNLGIGASLQEMSCREFGERNDHRLGCHDVKWSSSGEEWLVWNFPTDIYIRAEEKVGQKVNISGGRKGHANKHKQLGKPLLWIMKVKELEWLTTAAAAAAKTVKQPRKRFCGRGAWENHVIESAKRKIEKVVVEWIVMNLLQKWERWRCQNESIHV